MLLDNENSTDDNRQHTTTLTTMTTDKASSDAQTTTTGDEHDYPSATSSHLPQVICSDAQQQSCDRNDSVTARTMSGDNNNSSLGVLNWQQIDKLDRLLETPVPIHGRGNFPTLVVRLKDFIRNLRSRLCAARVRVHGVRINGGVASYVLAHDDDVLFSDIDIIFACDLLQLEDATEATTLHGHQPDVAFSICCDVIKETVFACLLDYFPPLANKDKLNNHHLREAYVKKMVKVYLTSNGGAVDPKTPTESKESLKSSSRWSLISLCNNKGQNIELKFVDKMKRQFQFSVDAFQIHLDALLKFYDLEDKSNDMTVSMTEHFYPTVTAESLYGEFTESLLHLNEKLIATKSPEEIHGGGLLKYCNLLVRGYTPLPTLYATAEQLRTLEKYMCSRFFIDFSDLKEQEHKLTVYMESHFQRPSERALCVRYLERLYEIVDTSTVCLMGHERKLTLALIQNMAQRFSYMEEQQTAYEEERRSSGYSLEGNDTQTDFDITDKTDFYSTSYSRRSSNNNNNNESYQQQYQEAQRRQLANETENNFSRHIAYVDASSNEAINHQTHSYKHYYKQQMNQHYPPYSGTAPHHRHSHHHQYQYQQAPRHQNAASLHGAAYQYQYQKQHAHPSNSGSNFYNSFQYGASSHFMPAHQLTGTGHKSHVSKTPNNKFNSFIANSKSQQPHKYKPARSNDNDLLKGSGRTKAMSGSDTKSSKAVQTRRGSVVLGAPLFISAGTVPASSLSSLCGDSVSSISTASSASSASSLICSPSVSPNPLCYQQDVEYDVDDEEVDETCEMRRPSDLVLIHTPDDASISSASSSISSSSYNSLALSHHHRSLTDSSISSFVSSIYPTQPMNYVAKRASSDTRPIVFQCRVANSPHIEVFYNYYCPPTLPPMEDEAPPHAAFHSRSASFSSNASSVSSTTASSPVYFDVSTPSSDAPPQIVTRMLPSSAAYHYDYHNSMSAYRQLYYPMPPSAAPSSVTE